MGESFCGKDCSSCQKCSGCEVASENCPIASCAKSSGVFSCNNCDKKSGCEKYYSKYSQEPTDIGTSSLSELNTNATANLSDVGKYVWILFWNIIAGAVISLIVSVSGLDGTIFDKVLSAASSCVAIAMLFFLSKHEDYFKKALYFEIASLALNIVIGFIPAELSGLILFFDFIDCVVSIGYLFFYTHGFSNLCRGSELSETWLKIFKWLVICIVAMFVSVFLLVLIPGLGLLLILLSALATIATAIIEAYTLYRTAKYV